MVHPCMQQHMMGVIEVPRPASTKGTVYMVPTVHACTCRVCTSGQNVQTTILEPDVAFDVSQSFIFQNLRLAGVTDRTDLCTVVFGVLDLNDRIVPTMHDAALTPPTEGFPP